MAVFQLNVLGGFELRRNGNLLHLPTRKAEALLAYMAVAPHAHARDALASLLWSETSDQSARASLRQTLFLLAKALDRSVLLAEGRTVALSHSAIDIDVVEFARCSARADVEGLNRAADLYRGDLLAGIAVEQPLFDEWLLAERERLRERAIDILDRLVGLHEQQGNCDHAIQAAQRLIALDSLQESAHRALMRLYASAGRRAAALQQYQTCVNALERELGAQPDAETTQLYDDILQRPMAPAAATPSRLPQCARYPNNLPPPRTRLIGRDRDVAEVCHLIERDDTGLVILSGAGGTGKTCLATHVMSELLDRFEGEVFFVDLAPLAEPALVMRAIAQALDVREAPGEPILQTVVTYISNRSMLIVLDNFEHVLDAAPQVSAIVSACGRVKLLITTRVRLHLYGEREYVLSPLPVPDLQHLPHVSELRRISSIELFEHRAREAKADFEITGSNAAAVAEICSRVDGLPLGIELAAARIRILSPARMLARLSDPTGEEHGFLARGSTLGLLTRGARDLPARQQTLRATIEWSYELLDSRECDVFRRLCIFVGGFTLEAAEAVTGDDAIDVLTSLVDKHFVQQTAAEERFTLFETIREFGLEQLHKTGQMDQLRKCHAEWFTSVAETSEPQIRDPAGSEAPVHALLRDYANLRSALAWSCSAAEQDRRAAILGLRLASALWWFWYLRGDVREGRSWLDRLLRANQYICESDPQLLHWRAKAFVGTAHLAEQQGDIAAARSLIEEGLRLTRLRGDRQLLGSALRTAAGLAIHEKNYGIAAALLEESLQLCLKGGDRLGTSLTYIRLGHLALAQGELDRAQAFYERRLETSKADGNQRGVATVLSFLGAVSIARRDYEGGCALSRESLQMMRRCGASVLSVVTALSNLVSVARHAGNSERAVRLLGALDRFRLSVGMTELVPGRIDEGTKATLRACLGEALFQSALRDGQEMSQNRLLEYALEE